MTELTTPATSSQRASASGDPGEAGIPPVSPGLGADVAAGPAAPPLSTREEVLVLDFGGQYSQLIARRIRECGVFAELLPHDTSLEAIAERRPAALVLSGGPASVYSDGAPA